MKFLKYITALLVLLVLVSSFTEHEYYVSVTNIEYAGKQKSLQVISQVFINDFEKLLRERYDENITLASNDESEMVDTYMQRYLSDKLNIKVNGSSVKFNFIGKEYKDDIAYCYLEIENISDINTLEVTNRTLFDVFPEQQNIVRLKLLGKNRSFLLVPDNDKCMLNFD